MNREKEAFEIMVRRGWGVVHPAFWQVIPDNDDPKKFKKWCKTFYGHDPVEIVLGAEKWYVEKVEGKVKP